MVDNTFSFNNDVTIKVYTHDNVPTTRYADLIKHLKDEKPMLVLNGEFVAYETDDSGWHQADKKYAVEPVANVAFAKQDGEHIICRIEADANMNYDLNTPQGIEDLNTYTQEKTDSLNKTLNRWVEVREHWKSKFGIEN